MSVTSRSTGPKYKNTRKPKNKYNTFFIFGVSFYANVFTNFSMDLSLRHTSALIMSISSSISASLRRMCRLTSFAFKITPLILLNNVPSMRKTMDRITGPVKKRIAFILKDEQMCFGNLKSVFISNHCPS